MKGPFTLAFQPSFKAAAYSGIGEERTIGHDGF
jgi:hypothetical protein